MSAIDTTFARLRAAGRKAFVPFVTAGDPDLAFTAEVLRELARRGAAICEVGAPYSDPVADGPVIQASYTRALARGLKLAQIFDMLTAFTREGAAREPGGSTDAGGFGEGVAFGDAALAARPPVVTMTSYAIVFRRGLAKYVAAAKAAGVAGLIVPDLPLEEAGSLADLCRKEDISLIQLVTPTTPRDRAARIAERASGFLYHVSITGITGERRELPPELLANVEWLRGRTPLPICIGFGVGTPEQARLLAPAADGVIVGSALVRRVAEANQRPRDEVLREVGEFAASMVAALE